MITDDEVMRLFAEADPARQGLAVVVGAPSDREGSDGSHYDETTIPDRSTSREARVGRRNWTITAAAAAAVLLVAGVVLVAREDGTHESTTAVDDPWSSQRVGVIGLPPEGATLSEPRSGAAVVELQSCEDLEVAMGFGGCDFIFVYADGHVIWRFTGNLPEGANRHSTGWLEQWLTPAGVDFFRARFDSTDDPRLVFARLRDPLSWPSGTWADPEIRPYLPPRYSVCFVRSGNAEILHSIVEELPPAAQDLMRDWEWSANHEPWTALYCANTPISVEEARALVAILNDAGVPQDAEKNAYALAYEIDDGQPENIGIVHLVFGPDNDARTSVR